MSHSWKARFNSKCRRCGEPIRKGVDMAASAPDAYGSFHAGCVWHDNSDLNRRDGRER